MESLKQALCDGGTQWGAEWNKCEGGKLIGRKFTDIISILCPRWRQKRYQEAESKFTAAIDSREQWFGKSHPLVIDVKHDLARLLADEGNQMLMTMTDEHGKTIQDIPQFPCLWQPSGPLSAFIENQRLASKLVDRFKYLINLLPFNYNNCNAKSLNFDWKLTEFIVQSIFSQLLTFS